MGPSIQIFLVFYLVFFSVPQWFVLRNYLDKAYGWMIWSLIGAISYLLTLQIFYWFEPLSGIIIISLFQYIFLKKHLHLSFLWLFVSPLSLYFGITISTSFSSDIRRALIIFGISHMQPDTWLAFIFACIFYGVSTGVLLAFLMNYTARKKRAQLNSS